MNNTTPTVTKKIKFQAILDLVDWANDNGYAFSETVPADMIQAFIEKEITALDNKAVSAQKRAAERKVEGDALRDKVESYLTDEPQTVRTIVTAINDPDVSDQMVVSRLKQLVDAGRVTKDTTRVAAVEGGKARTLVTYRLA